MPRIAYVNGRYVRHADAAVHIEDRGYQFADGVYEVCEVARGYIMDMTRHLDRLDRSLGELEIAWPMARKALQIVMREVVRAQPRRQRPGLSAGDARRGAAATMSFPAAARVRRWSSPPSARDPAAAAEARRDRHQGDHRAGKPLGPRRHQDGRAAAERAGASRRPRSPAPRKPGSSIPTARSRKALRPTPGSSPGTASWSPARPSTASCAASPARRCSTLRPSSG